MLHTAKKCGVATTWMRQTATSPRRDGAKRDAAERKRKVGKKRTDGRVLSVTKVKNANGTDNIVIGNKNS